MCVSVVLTKLMPLPRVPKLMRDGADFVKLNQGAITSLFYFPFLEPAFALQSPAAPGLFPLRPTLPSVLDIESEEENDWVGALSGRSSRSIPGWGALHTLLCCKPVLELIQDSGILKQLCGNIV